MNENDFLEKVSIFSYMKKRDLRRIAKMARHHTYRSDHSETEFSHSICPDCAEKLYPDFGQKG